MKLSNRWRLKGKLKYTIILLFCFSFLFISYQVLYYSSLNQFQTQEDSDQAERYRKLKEDLPKKETDELLVYVGKHGTLLSTHQKNFIQSDQIDQPQFGKLLSLKVIGVAPEHWSFYDRRNKKLFTCLSSGKKISWDRVNDNYCDCPLDGSDEPSTPACMNGRFFCSKGSKGFKEYIPSSRINDGICDCCNGEDELNKNAISCKDRC